MAAQLGQSCKVLAAPRTHYRPPPWWLGNPAGDETPTSWDRRSSRWARISMFERQLQSSRTYERATSTEGVPQRHNDQRRRSIHARVAKETRREALRRREGRTTGYRYRGCSRATPLKPTLCLTHTAVRETRRTYYLPGICIDRIGVLV